VTDLQLLSVLPFGPKIPVRWDLPALKKSKKRLFSKGFAPTGNFPKFFRVFSWFGSHPG
jgi:hypothetical protein